MTEADCWLKLYGWTFETGDIVETYGNILRFRASKMKSRLREAIVCR
jgi:hypothetical protein